MKIVLATHNKNKVKEIKEILNSLNINADILSLKDINMTDDVAETGLTFKKNASIKADFFKNEEYAVLAEDSGLEVAALNNLPGVFSKRMLEFSTGNSKDDDNLRNEMIIESLEDEHDRSARFIASYCFITKDNKKFFAEGTVYGKIATNIISGNGFAYDDIFLANELNGKRLSLATPEEKNNISHRKKALSILFENLKELNIL